MVASLHRQATSDHLLPPLIAWDLRNSRMLGFTLMEMVITIAILAILVSLAAPGFQSLILSQRVKNASFDVFSSITYARSEAVTRNAPVTITPTTAGNWANGWSITAADGTVLKTENALPNITLTGPASVSYNGMGHRDTTVPCPFPSNRCFSLSGTGVSASNSRCIRIDPSGRPSTANETC